MNSGRNAAISALYQVPNSGSISLEIATNARCFFQTTLRLWSSSGAASELNNLPAEIRATRHPPIKKAVFVKSSSHLDQMPEPNIPEFAFLGHSNVGKSSLINMLTGVQALAHVSKTPGRTKSINHFLVNNKYYLVDCPGYGYAKVSKQQRAEWHHLTQEYLMSRQSLVHTFLLVDGSTFPAGDMDKDGVAWFAQHKVPCTVLLTKVDASGEATTSIPGDTGDKLVSDQRMELANAVVQDLSSGLTVPSGRKSYQGRKRLSTYGESRLSCITTSAKTGLGRKDVLSLLWTLQEEFRPPISFK